jgi:hypothetical protein
MAGGAVLEAESLGMGGMIENGPRSLLIAEAAICYAFRLQAGMASVAGQRRRIGAVMAVDAHGVVSVAQLRLGASAAMAIGAGPSDVLRSPGAVAEKLGVVVAGRAVGDSGPLFMQGVFEGGRDWGVFGKRLLRPVNLLTMH